MLKHRIFKAEVNGLVCVVAYAEVGYVLVSKGGYGRVYDLGNARALGYEEVKSHFDKLWFTNHYREVGPANENDKKEFFKFYPFLAPHFGYKLITRKTCI